MLDSCCRNANIKAKLSAFDLNAVPLAAKGHIMREYHFYLLDRNSQIQSTKITYCADDADALRFARQLQTLSDIEVWCGAHLVARLNAKGENVPTARGAA